MSEWRNEYDDLPVKMCWDYERRIVDEGFEPHGGYVLWLEEEATAQKARVAELEARIAELQAERLEADRRRWQQNMRAPREIDPTAPPESEVTG